MMNLRRLHTFVSREKAFQHDDVLQETVIFHAVKGSKLARVTVTSSNGPDDLSPTSRIVDYDQVVRPDDPQAFIHIPTNPFADEVVERLSACQTTLADLGLAVSTGRVVDFRAREYLRDQQGKDTVPLIWQAHFVDGYITWPKQGARKPQAFVDADAVRSQLVPNDAYVLTRRFSAKEERRRIVAAVHDPTRIETKMIAFENHLNYFHRNGSGIGLRLARGLAVFLNSTLVDQYFRQFSGHTQVNATDLRNMRYPTQKQLQRIGSKVGKDFPDQDVVDTLLARELFGAKNGTSPARRPERNGRRE